MPTGTSAVYTPLIIAIKGKIINDQNTIISADIFVTFGHFPGSSVILGHFLGVSQASDSQNKSPFRPEKKFRAVLVKEGWEPVAFGGWLPILKLLFAIYSNATAKFFG